MVQQLKEGDRIKIQRNAHMKRKGGTNYLKGVWEVTGTESRGYDTPVYTIKKVGRSGNTLSGKSNHLAYKQSTIEKMLGDEIQHKHDDYHPLGMRDLSVHAEDPNMVDVKTSFEAGRNSETQNNLSLGQIPRSDRKDSEEANMRKAVSTWLNQDNRWSGTRAKNVYPEDLPMYFSWYNSEEYDARREEPDAIIVVDRR